MLRRTKKDARDRGTHKEAEESVKRLENDGGGRRRTEEGKEGRMRTKNAGGGLRNMAKAEGRRKLWKAERSWRRMDDVGESEGRLKND